MNRRVLAPDNKAAAMNENHDWRGLGVARRPDIQAKIVIVTAITAVAHER